MTFSTWLHLGPALFFILSGFFGVLVLSQPLSRTLAWAWFQAGLILFLLQMAVPSLNPLPLSLLIELTLVSLVLGALLAFWALRVKDEGRSPGERGS